MLIDEHLWVDVTALVHKRYNPHIQYRLYGTAVLPRGMNIPQEFVNQTESIVMYNDVTMCYSVEQHILLQVSESR